MGSAQFFTVPAGGTYISNDVVNHPALTYEALGVLVHMLAMHPARPKTIETLTGRGLGRRAVRNALACLEAAGFRWRFKYSREDGQWCTAVILSPLPMSEHEAFLSVVQFVTQDGKLSVKQWLAADNTPLTREGIRPAHTDIPVTDSR